MSGGDKYYRSDVFVNGVSYPIVLGTGTKFAVQETKTAKYILLPEETVKLSPLPLKGK
jgi:hypothetical protein